MFCIRSDVVTLRSIEMYGLVTVWTSMDDGPYWVILLMYGSHDMRHTGFRRLTVVNGTPGFLGVTVCYQGLGRRLAKNPRDRIRSQHALCVFLCMLRLYVHDCVLQIT